MGCKVQKASFSGAPASTATLCNQWSNLTCCQRCFLGRVPLNFAGSVWVKEKHQSILSFSHWLLFTVWEAKVKMWQVATMWTIELGCGSHCGRFRDSSPSVVLRWDNEDVGHQSPVIKCFAQSRKQIETHQSNQGVTAACADVVECRENIQMSLYVQSGCACVLCESSLHFAVDQRWLIVKGQ